MAKEIRLYASTDRGVVALRSTDQGWEETGRLAVNTASRTIQGSRHRPERVFAGVYHDGVYRTEDAGGHWTKVFDGHVRSVAVDPNDEDVIYAGTEPVQLHRSEDGGDHWEEIRSLQLLPEEIKKEWSFPVPPHIGHVLKIFIQPEDSRTIYLCLEHGGIVRSLDRGHTWEDVSTGIDYLDIHSISTLPGHRDRYYTATARGFFASNDPADGWVRAETGFTRDYFHDFIFLPSAREDENPTMLIATADKSPGSWRRPEGAWSAMFRSLDCGESWHRIGAGLPETMEDMVWALTPHPYDPNSAYIGLGAAFEAAGDDSKVGALLETRDRGESWQSLAVAVPPVRALWATSA